MHFIDLLIFSVYMLAVIVTGVIYLLLNKDIECVFSEGSITGSGHYSFPFLIINMLKK